MMNLQEFIEYEDNSNDEELNEALKIFKKSKQFKKYADKIESKLVTAKAKGKLDAEKAKMIEEIIKEARMAPQEFQRVEDKFKEKKLDRKKAKEEIKRLKSKYSGLDKKINSDRVKKIAKIIGASALIVGLAGGLNWLFAPITQTFATGADMSGAGVMGSESLGRVGTTTTTSNFRKLMDRRASQ